MRTRIVKLSDGYVVQARKSIFSHWEGVDRDYPISFTWFGEIYQLKHCKVKTKEAAEKLLVKYLNHINDVRKLK